MIRTLQRWVHGGFGHAEAALDRVFTARHNPLYQLGALSFHAFWIVTVTGIWLFVFFDTSILSAYASVEAITHEQWYVGGLMRSLHRYASGMMAVTVTLHLLREFGLGRFRGVRWYSWFTGVPLLWLLFASAIGGYWLVWDELAQYLAVATSEWLDWLPIFGGLARNYLTPQLLSDRLFSLLVYLHIAIPLLLFIGMLLHVKRLKLAAIHPSREMAVLVLASLAVVSLLVPATSMGPADLSRTAARINLDWFYLNLYPLLDRYGPGPLWAFLFVLSTALAVLPWTSRERTVAADEARPAPRVPGTERSAPAVVNPDFCNGCSWCFQDCPHEAVTMVPHDYKPGMRQARVNPDLCTGCGICAGACPSSTPFRHVEELVSGIEIPAFSLDRLRRTATERLAALGERGGIVVIGCDHGANLAAAAGGAAVSLSLPCTGMLPPSFADFLSRQPRVDGVLVTGCPPHDCYYRKGSEWTEQRFAGARQPHLRTAAGRDKVRIRWAGAAEGGRLAEEVARFAAERGGEGGEA